MTKYSKSRTTRIIVKCILGIIILSLIFSTMNNYINKDFEKYIVTINGEKIPFKIFQNMYSIEIEKQKKILGKKFFIFENNKQFVKETYNYVLSQLINNILLEQYTKKMKLETDNNDIKNIILSSPIFQKNKKFNKEKYFNYLSSVHLNNHEYINIIKTKINTEKLIQTIANTDFLLENEKKNMIKLLSQKRIIRKAIFKINSITKNQKVNNTEAEKYFHKNKKKFYIPEKFKVDFIKLKPNIFKINCNNKEINEWYVNNIKKYFTKEKRRYSVIQIKYKKDALLILSQLKQKPENFPKIAKEQSIDPISSKKNGDIGWISVDSIPIEIKNANLSQKKQISDIIPFRDEFLIIQLNDIEISKKKKINQVYKHIEEEIKNKKSLNLYDKLQTKISKIIKEHPNQFDLLLKKINLSYQTTNWFDKNSIPKILNIPIIKEVIFNKPLIQNNFQSHLHFIILNNKQSFLINVKDFQNKKMQTFENVKNYIIKKIKIKKAIKEAKRTSNKIIFELKKGNKKSFQKYNLYFNDPETISRYDKKLITSKIFSLPHPKNGEKVYTLYQNKNKNFEIILLEKIYNQNFSKEEQNMIIEYLEKNNIELIFNSILKNLYENSTIKYENLDFF